MNLPCTRQNMASGIGVIFRSRKILFGSDSKSQFQNELAFLFILFFFPQGTDQLFITSRLEQVHTLQMAHGVWHPALFEAYGNNKYFSILQQFGLLKRDLQFLMAVTRLLIKSLREADQNPIAVQNRLTDLVLPILSGLKVLRV